MFKGSTNLHLELLPHLSVTKFIIIVPLYYFPV